MCVVGKRVFSPPLGVGRTPTTPCRKLPGSQEAPRGPLLSGGLSAGTPSLGRSPSLPTALHAASVGTVLSHECTRCSPGRSKAPSEAPGRPRGN